MLRPHRSSLRPSCLRPAWKCSPWRLVAGFLLALALGPNLSVSLLAADQTDPPTVLPRITPLEPAEALHSFEIAAGFRIELVAAEPLVIDPVAFCFDSQGRLIVVEMRGYSERPDDRAGRVRRLTDHDGDGTMDAAQTLLEGLSWPTAVACSESGILVADAPDLIFLPNPAPDAPAVTLDGAGEQAPAERLWEGFAKTNVQGLVNSFVWGLDLRLHGSGSSNGGDLRPLFASPASPLVLGRRDFAIDWPGRTIESVDGGGQHGMMIDPWGDKYVCSNSDHLQQVWLAPARSWRTSRTSAPLQRRRSIADDGPQADVYRLSPVEPWRLLRTHLRVTGQAAGPIEGGGRAAGYFTGATGIYVYDGDQWESTDHPIALVCDVGSNLVHRKRLDETGLWKRGSRIDPQTEFLRSRDIWFRPVQLGTGPDGALYIADMYREVIEHPLSLPPLIKSQLDLNSGNDRGRIYRVVSTSQPIRRTNDLSHLPPVELARMIDHRNAWQRRTAGRMILEAKLFDTAAELRRIVREGVHPEGRLQALATLAALARTIEHAPASPPSRLLDFQTLTAAIADDHPRVRQRAVEYGTIDPAMVAEIPLPVRERLAKDPSIFVRFQVAWDAAVWFPERSARREALAHIASQDPHDPGIIEAVEGSLGADSVDFVAAVLSAPAERYGASRDAWLRAGLFQSLGDGQPATIERLATLVGSSTGGERSAWMSALAAVAALLPYEPRFAPLAPLWQEMWHDESRATLTTAPAAIVVPAMELVRWSDPAAATAHLTRLLAPETAPTLQGLALQHLMRGDAPSCAVVVERLETLTPAQQRIALERLVASREGVRQLIAAGNAQKISPVALPREIRDALLQFCREDPSLGQWTALGDEAAEAGSLPAEVITQYTMALTETPDTAQGRLHFHRVCAACHRADGVGNQIGPELKSVLEKSPEQILQSILEPNLEVDPRYRIVQIQTFDGRLLAGLVEEELDQEIRIADGQGNRQRIARNEIEVLRTLDRSLMPEELYRELTPPQMRDLIGFLKSSRR